MNPGFFFREHLRHISDFLRILHDPPADDPVTDRFRPLTEIEISQLLSQGCISQDWSRILVSEPTQLETCRNTTFIGRVRLDWGGVYTPHQHLIEEYEQKAPVSDHDPAALLPAGIHNSRIADSFIGAGARIIDCSIAAACFIEPNAVLFQSNAEPGADGFPFSEGAPVSLLNEAQPIQYALFPDTTMDMIIEWVRKFRSHRHHTPDTAQQTALGEVPRNLYRLNILGAASRVSHTRLIRGVYVGPGCSVRSADEIFRSALLGGILLPSSDTGRSDYIPATATIGPGAIIHDSTVQPGARVDSHARVTRSCILETGGAENSAVVRDSIIGPGSILGQGEVTASIVGPLTGQHHASLLIAADWSRGCGNIGYGANIGSNHSSRLADQEIRIGEGIFFGLDCAVQFPGNYQNAPYTVVATSVVLSPQCLEMPFSLIVKVAYEAPEHNGPAAETSLIPAGSNRLIPGWTLRNNMFAVLRNWIKHQSRFHARLHRINTFPFRAEMRAVIQSALDQLVRISQQTSSEQRIITAADCPGIGANIVYRRDIAHAVAAYRQAIRFGELWERWDASRQDAAIALSRAEITEFTGLLHEMISSAQASRSKDFDQHRAIFPEDRIPENHEHLIQSDRPLAAALDPLRSRLQELSSI